MASLPNAGRVAILSGLIQTGEGTVQVPARTRIGQAGGVGRAPV